MDIKDIHSLFLSCNSISIDSRRITENSFFVAIKGDKFDANTFAKEALDKGAAYVMIDNKDYYIDQRTLLVENSLTALQELAKYHRAYLKLPIIALTGSNGKTTTKELIYAVLSKKFNTKATLGNLNNHIGVPLTLLSFTEQTEIGIVEMGANHQKEIEFLCNIAQPDYGYITNFGKAHLEGFGGVEGVIKGKSEMYQYLSAHNKLAFVNLEDPIQELKSKEMKRFSFGLNKEEANLPIDHISANPLVCVSYGQNEINTQLIGLYNANNVSAAIAIGTYFEVADAQIKEALASYVPENNRSQLMQKRTNEIILDAYNANPSSMKAAIDNFLLLDKKNKILFLGDMFELGEASLAEHKELVDFLAGQPQVKCCFIGKDFNKVQIEKGHFSFFADFEAFSKALQSQLFEGNTILIKGSRGMALERSLDFI